MEHILQTPHQKQKARICIISTRSMHIFSERWRLGGMLLTQGTLIALAII
jgi:hypothetical protein